ncbi:hypothetical protein G9C98_001511 [Cotesia typhae]|uniref:SUN domain-containing protein n=1 Tax=Cotesia typhae TaxID=2053667 RepID=A0A8J5VB37_9HYME|nr:hypothetical protein G9C98_001511 [Cotesia typhae]
MRLHHTNWIIFIIFIANNGFLFNNVATKDIPNPLLENDHGYGIVKNVSSSDTGQSKRETLESFLISKIELPAHDKTDKRQHNFVDNNNFNKADDDFRNEETTQTKNLDIKESLTRQPNLSQGISEPDQDVVLTLIDTASTELHSIAKPHLSSNHGQASTNNISQSIVSSDLESSVEDPEKLKISTGSPVNLILDENITNFDESFSTEQSTEFQNDEIQRQFLQGHKNLPNDSEKIRKTTEELSGSRELEESTTQTTLLPGSSEESGTVSLDGFVGSDDSENHEDIPSYNEWTQKKMEEDEKKKTHPNISIQNLGTPNRSVGSMKVRSKNYASLDCGAKVAGSNSGAQGARNVLVSTRDEYMLNPCTSKVWFVVELCEAIQAKKIELANFELFSSSPKNFSVFISKNPTKDWSPVGQFIAKDERDIQSFYLQPQLFGKFIKVELHSHYDSTNCKSTVTHSKEPQCHSQGPFIKDDIFTTDVKNSKVVNPSGTIAVNEKEIFQITPTKTLIDVDTEKKEKYDKSKEKDQEDIKLTPQEQLSLDTLLLDLKALENDPSIQGSTASTVVQPVASSTPQQKESVFLRLSNRIKTLERNMSLSAQYLEELSRRYKKQVEEMQRSLERATTTIGEEFKKNEEKELKRLEEITLLREEILSLTEFVETLLHDKSSWKNKLLIFGQHIVLIFVEITILIIIIILCRKPNDDVTIKKNGLNKGITRRKSAELITTGSTNKKCRRPSEIVSRIKGSYRDLIIDERLDTRKERKKKRRRDSVIRSSSNIEINKSAILKTVLPKQSLSINCSNFENSDGHKIKTVDMSSNTDNTALKNQLSINNSDSSSVQSISDNWEKYSRTSGSSRSGQDSPSSLSAFSDLLSVNLNNHNGDSAKNNISNITSSSANGHITPTSDVKIKKKEV